ncbi:MAG: hypothetical protein ACFCD0_01685 [Gemmataceae bacterium]
MLALIDTFRTRLLRLLASSRSDRQLSSRRRAVGLERLEDRNAPAVLTVTTLADVTDPSDGVLSLREAVELANTNVDPANTIEFSTDVAGSQLDLTNGELTVTKDLTIQTSGSRRTTLDAGNSSRIFEVEEDVRFSLEGVTLQNGFADEGAALYAHEGAQVSLIQSGFQNNTASQNGGALYADRSTNLIITDSDFLNNAAGSDGGAIYLRGVATITNTDLETNQAGDDGGAIYGRWGSQTSLVDSGLLTNYSGDDGGGVYVSGGGLTTSDTVFEGNFAQSGGGAILATSTTVSIDRSEFRSNSANTGDGGAIRSSSTNLVISNSGFERNTARMSSNGSSGRGGAVYVYSGSGTITDSTFTLNTAENQGGAIFFSSGSHGTVVNSVFYANSAELGGGAVAASGATVWISGTVLQDNLTWGDGGAVRASSTTLTVTNTQLFGNSVDTLSDGSRGRGGAIFAYKGGLTVDGSVFQSNTAKDDGGAIMVHSTQYGVTIRTTVFQDNTSEDDGGAVASRSNRLALTNNNFKNNEATHRAGALFAFQGTTTIDGIIFESNEAGQDGGAFYADQSNLTIQNTLFDSNLAGDDGGGLYSATNTVDIIDSIFQDNVAEDDGGALYLKPLVTATVTMTLFLNNTASDTAGAVFIRSSDVDFIDSLFEGNTANHVAYTGDADDGNTGLLAFDAAALAHSSARFTNTTIDGSFVDEATVATDQEQTALDTVFAEFPVLEDWL